MCVCMSIALFRLSVPLMLWLAHFFMCFNDVWQCMFTRWCKQFMFQYFTRLRIAHTFIINLISQHAHIYTFINGSYLDRTNGPMRVACSKLRLLPKKIKLNVFQRVLLSMFEFQMHLRTVDICKCLIDFKLLLLSFRNIYLPHEKLQLT